MCSSRRASLISAGASCAARCARGGHLGRAQVGGGLVEHAVDVLVAVGAAEALGQLDRFVDGHAVGNVQAVRQLVARRSSAPHAPPATANVVLRSTWRASTASSAAASRMQPCSSASKCVAVAACRSLPLPAGGPRSRHRQRPTPATGTGPSAPVRASGGAPSWRPAGAPRRLGSAVMTGLPSGWPSRPPRARRRGPCPRHAPRPGLRSPP